MKYLLRHICISFIIYSHLSNGKPSKPRQFPNISFAIPVLNLLGGGNINSANNQNNINNQNNLNNNNNNINNNNNNNAGGLGGLGGLGGNIFRQVTVTRTIVRTVSTVTQGVPRTCTTTAAVAAFGPCPGRRRRSALIDGKDENGIIVPTELSMVVIVGSTTISNQKDVSDILKLTPEEPATTLQPSPLDDGEDLLRTTLYPSQDSLDIAKDDLFSAVSEDADAKTTSLLHFDEDVTTSHPEDLLPEEPNDNDLSRAGINFAGTTTTIVTIPVTAVSTSTISIAGAAVAAMTFTISYGGCSPSSLPITGSPLCV